MTISATQVASQNGTQTRPTQFKSQVTALESVQVLALQYDPLKTLINVNQLYLLESPDKTGADFGYNSQMHVGHKANWAITSGQVKTYACPIAVPGTSTVSAGTFTFSVGTLVAGTYAFYIHGVRLSIGVVATDQAEDVADKFVAAVNASNEVLVTAAAVDAVVTLTSTFKALTANDIRFTGPIVRKNDPLVPDGLTVVIVQPTSGTGDESTVLEAAWDAIVAHPEWKTDVITPTQAAAALGYADAAIGLPDVAGQGTGLWADADYRPCTNWVAQIDDLSTSIALTASRTEDPNNVFESAPDYLEMPFVIAINAASYVGFSANGNPATKYENARVNLQGPLDVANDWTSGVAGSTNVNTAVDAGLSVIKLNSDENPVLGDVTTPYRPVGVATPVFKFEVNKRKTWNVAQSVKNDKLTYTNDVIVESVEEASSQAKATDDDAEKARIVTMSEAWVRFGWIYNGTFTTSNMIVEISTENTDRIDRAIPILLSGNKRVMSDTILVDRNLSIADASVVVKIG